MKFTCRVEINKPIEEVVELIMDPGNLDKWQDGFMGLEHVSGPQGVVGSKTRLFYKMGRKKMALLETIEINDLPHEFTALYEHVHMTNRMQNLFEALDANHTRYSANIEYLKFVGILPKLMATLFPGMFRKQTQKWLDQFKAFAESV
ncbi:MAG: SRPBCC family protein [Saprospiraceae bacterium]|nr:SRPBCC family protein [Saprospiraceae bacterium]